MIQEVVGTRIGHYYFPAFAGVAFSNNEFPWSSRIKRGDGLVRIVPGLGTRAVDRVGDDYPVLAAPGQPGLRVNVSLDEIVRYSPQKIDVINLESSLFETVSIQTLLKEYGREYPCIQQVVSVISQDHLEQPRALRINFEQDNLVVTFEELLSKTDFLEQIRTILNELQDKFQRPIDIEFAHDGTDFYLLQCRSQSFQEDSNPALIPRGIPKERIVFSANRYISNGTVANITHVVYVDSQEYGDLSNYQDLLDVGRVVGRLNKLLPKRRFILIGPGRWGSRGDRKLGVQVTYSDINNASMLIEIARKRGDYMPDPSFGTHFFQDLVEASIRYLPLYPDDFGIVFNDAFLTASENILADVLPEFVHLLKVVKVIDIPSSTDGLVLQVYMNADTEEAIAILTEPTDSLTTDLETGGKRDIALVIDSGYLE
ncbi:MAG: PEP/pyruvate-binding domain-containing protein, partial [Chloroflexota bacterium]